MSDLKPCPFCGGEATHDTNGSEIWVICKKCGARCAGSFFSGKKGVQVVNERWNKRVPSAQPKHTEERTETHACDCVSGVAAIIAAIEAVDEWDGGYNVQRANMIRDAIKALPSAQPEQRWIPVTERLPEEREWLGTKKFGTTISDEVYVTFENPKGERFCKHLSFQNGKLSAYDKSTIDAFYKGSKPIAWMPLPEAYKGEQE